MTDFILLQLVPLFLMIGIVIGIYCFTRLLFARILGIKISKVSMGIGFDVHKTRGKSGTIWQYKTLPFLFSNLEYMNNLWLFRFNKSYIKQSIVNYLGIFILFLSGYLLLFSDKVQFGHEVSPPVIGKVLKKSAAEKADLKIGDRILSVDGIKVNSLFAINEYLKLKGAKPVTLVVLRNNQELKLSLTPERKRGSMNAVFYKMGIYHKNDQTRFDPVTPAVAARHSLNETYGFTLFTINMVANRISGKTIFQIKHLPTSFYSVPFVNRTAIYRRFTLQLADIFYIYALLLLLYYILGILLSPIVNFISKK